MANKILVARATKARIETIKETLETYEVVYATDTKELGIKLSDGNIEYFTNATDIDAIVDALETSKQDKLVAGTNITIDENTNEISATGDIGGTVDWQDVQNKPELQEKLTAGDNITIDENNVISASGGGEVDLDGMDYFNFAGSIYGAKYSLLVSAWEHSLTVDPLEISADNESTDLKRGKAQYPNGHIEGVIIPQGVTRIGNHAFNQWLNNQPLVIPDSVTSIGTSAFYAWTINNHPLVIPNSVTTIGDYAFSVWRANNYPLVIPDSVTHIGFSTFSNWEVNTHPLVIPASVTSIDSAAFYGWALVPYVEMKSATPPTLASQNAFAGQNNAPIYVPDESVDDYKTATYWATHASRIFPISDINKRIEAQDIRFNGSGTNYLTAKTEVESAIKELDTRVKTNADNMPSQTVESVNGKQGVVVLNQDDIGDGSTYKRVSQTEKNTWNNKQDKLIAGENITIDPNTNEISAIVGSSGDATLAFATIPFTELMSDTQTVLHVAYIYVGDDPVNLTADFSDFTLGDGLVLDMGSGPIPASMAVQAIFGKTTLNYFEIIILFRYILTATFFEVIKNGSVASEVQDVLRQYEDDYADTFSNNVFEGISDSDMFAATFVVDFMVVCDAIPFYNTVTGRGSNITVSIETAGDLDDVETFGVDGMTLKLIGSVKMTPNSGGGGSDYELTKLKIEAALEGGGSNSIQLGNSATASATNSIAIGNEASASGLHSTAAGRNAAASGDYSTALGNNTGATYTGATAVGYRARAWNTNATALGYRAYVGGSSSTALGHDAGAGSADNLMQLGSTELSTLRAEVSLTVTSDIRDKADIEEVPKALDFIKDLKPITYVRNDRDKYISDEQKETETYRDYLMVEDYDRESHSQGTRKGKRRRVGLSAQEVREKLIEHYGSDNYANVVNDNFVEFEERGLDIPEGLENKLTMSYETMVPFLIKAIQEQQEQIEELKKKINEE